MKLIVTRPAAQAAIWLRDLQALGVDAAALPLLEIAPPRDAAPVHAAWRELARQALVVFVSANAVQHFFALRPPSADWPATALAGATGPGTAAALREAGVPQACIVEPAADAPQFDSEALWQRLAGRDWQDLAVLVVRGEDGRDWLAETLKAHGARPAFVAAYRRAAPAPDAAGRELLAAAQAHPSAHVWLFSSSEAVRHLRELAPAADWSLAQALASHPRIAAAAHAAGFERVDAVVPTPQAVAEALRKLQALRERPIEWPPL